jgi:hypothetical protein
VNSTWEDINFTDKILVGKPEEKGHLCDIGIDGRIILKLILEKYSVRVWMGFNWLKIWPDGMFNKAMNLKAS